MAARNSTPPPYEVRDSAIHGRGVFAARDLQTDEQILEYIGEKIDKVESERRGRERIDRAAQTGEAAVYIFILNDEQDIDGSGPDNDARLINHSCDPNCEAWNHDTSIWIHALRPIKKGEELSFNYGFEVDTWEEHPCRCGSENCVGYIVVKEHWPQLKKEVARRDAKLAALKRGQKALRDARKIKKDAATKAAAKPGKKKSR